MSQSMMNFPEPVKACDERALYPGRVHEHNWKAKSTSFDSVKRECTICGYTQIVMK